ncbi:MAG: hypothetical protein HQK72_02290 [Desulfamplus sp.]|nr:hypothetical protein [Desulfamplus sp.]
MNLSPYELVIIAGGFTIVGALIGGLIAFRNTISIYNLSEFNKAASLFREAFYPEIIFIKHNAIIAGSGSSDSLSTFLSAGYLHRHLKAFETFKYYLSVKESEKIDKAWKEYCYDPNNPKILFFEQYSTRNVSHEHRETLKQLALTRIENILELAKHK